MIAIAVRRRTARQLDDLLGVTPPSVDLSGLDWYHLWGLDLGMPEREAAAPAPLLWAAA